MHNTLFYIILVVILADYLLDRYLEWLNDRNWSATLPHELSDVYDPKEYERSQRYHRDNNRFEWITSTFQLLVVLGMLFFNGFALVDSWARNMVSNPVGISLVFFGIIALASDIISIPFSVYEIFVIEEKYGFNKTTPRIFVTDKLKGYLLGLLLGVPLVALIVWFYTVTGKSFWLYTWGLVVFFLVFMNMFYSDLIVPLFNKQTPLPEGDLRNAILALAEKAGFPIKDIYVIDSSKRSTKSNAYFTGLGPRKRIVLYDTLIQDLSPEEITATLAHEIGHYKLKHTRLGLILSVIQTGITLFILSLFIDNPGLSRALGSEQQGFHLSLIAFGLLYSPISMVLGLGANLISRKHEYAADRFAAKLGLSHSLISALKKLSAKNLSNLTPHPAYVFFHYSHPTLLQRMKALTSFTLPK
ncbi:MAG: M48 family metallopeptidase [Bacteroidales bacterium]|jgi:STE24 endopeptidase|nr:M48 family metallopeptidase [Bacteroidales bacterium]